MATYGAQYLIPPGNIQYTTALYPSTDGLLLVQIIVVVVVVVVIVFVDVIDVAGSADGKLHPVLSV